MLIVVLAAMASVLAIALLRLRGHVDELERSRTGFQRALGRLGDALAGGLDRDAIVDVILEAGVLALDADAAVLYAGGAAHAPMSVRGSHGVITADGLTLEPGEGLPGLAAERGEVVLWPSPDHDRRPSPSEPAATTAAAAPIQSQGRLLGVLAVYRNRSGRPFATGEADALSTLVRQAETAIDNAVLHEEASRLAITDGLTGVWNRRHLDIRAAEELQRARRFHEPFSLVLVDVDNFKQVNDRFGHQGGDAVLVQVAERLSQWTREVDTVARYGGEEFALVLPRTDLNGAELLAEKVRSAIADTPFEVDGGPLRVTVSIGVSSHPDQGSTVADLVGAADAALYRAKAGGKNRVERADERVPEGSGG